jgi:YVTN family beta-propeller protein
MPAHVARAFVLLLVCAYCSAQPAFAQRYGYVVVTEYRNDSSPAPQKLIVFDTQTRGRAATIPLEMGCLGCGVPRTLVASPDGSRLFAINRGSNTVSVVDTTTWSVIRSLPIGAPPAAMPLALAVSPDGGRLYVLRGTTHSTSWSHQTAGGCM